MLPGSDLRFVSVANDEMGRTARTCECDSTSLGRGRGSLDPLLGQPESRLVFSSEPPSVSASCDVRAAESHLLSPPAVDHHPSFRVGDGELRVGSLISMQIPVIRG